MTTSYCNPFPSKPRNDFASRSIALPTRSIPQRCSPSAKADAQMQHYNELIDRLVRYLMQEGYNFIEAYDEVLAVGRLDPRTTVSNLSHTDPTTDREALLGFKAHNAISRLQRQYAALMNKYA